MNSTTIPSLEDLAKKHGIPLDAVVATAIDFGIPIYTKTPDDCTVYATEFQYLEILAAKDACDFMAQKEIGRIPTKPYQNILLLEIPNDHLTQMRATPNPISVRDFSGGLRFVNGRWQAVKPDSIDTHQDAATQISRKFRPPQFTLHKKSGQEILLKDHIRLIDLPSAEPFYITPSDLYINPDTIDEFWKALTSVTRNQVLQDFISEPLRCLYRAFEHTWVNAEITKDNISQWPTVMTEELKKHSEIFDSSNKIKNAVRFIKPDDYAKLCKEESSKQITSRAKKSPPGQKYQKLLETAKHFHTLANTGKKYSKSDIAEHLISLKVDFRPSSARAGASLIRPTIRDSQTITDTDVTALTNAMHELSKSGKVTSPTESDT